MRAQTFLQRGASCSTSPSATVRSKPLRQWQASRAATITTPVAQPVIDDFKEDRRPVILYDGVCNLCNGAVDFMLQWDTAGRFRMAALQSKAGERLLARCQRQGDISSIVVVEEDTHHIRSDAVLRIAREIGNPWPLFALLGYPVPSFLRDFAYDQVANNRYSFMGQRDVCRVSNAGFEDRFIVD